MPENPTTVSKIESVYIGMCVYNRAMDMEITSLLFELARSGKYKMGIDFQSSVTVEASRNQIAKNFLTTDCEWLYFWDADVVIKDKEFLDKLIETSKNLNAPVVGAPYLLKDVGDVYVIANQKGNLLINMKKGAIIKPMLVDALGCGSMLIHRSVLEDLEYPWFQTIECKNGHITEDYNFCLKAKKSGYLVACDPRFDTYHYAPWYWKHESSEP